jgi:hypothetical protein
MLDVDQAGELKAAFRRGDWTNAEIKKLSEGDVLAQVRKVVRGEAEITIIKRILKLVQAFDPASFINKDWAIWKGLIDGGGETGEEDRDVREDSLTQIDLADLLCETCLVGEETSITGGEKLRRLKKSNKIRLGGKAFLAFWADYQKNRENSMLEHLYKVYGVSYLDFFGLVLRSPGGLRYVLYLSRDAGGQWGWRYRWLGIDWKSGHGSASLAS